MIISSRQNERVKQVRALRNKGERDRTATFFVEGRQMLQAALDTGAVIEQAVVAPERLDEGDGVLVEELRRRGERHLRRRVYRGLKPAAWLSPVPQDSSRGNRR